MVRGVFSRETRLKFRASETGIGLSRKRSNSTSFESKSMGLSSLKDLLSLRGCCSGAPYVIQNEPCPVQCSDYLSTESSEYALKRHGQKIEVSRESGQVDIEVATTHESRVVSMLRCIKCKSQWWRQDRPAPSEVDSSNVESTGVESLHASGLIYERTIKRTKQAGK